MSSVDGRILGDRWGFKNPAQYFEKPASKIKVDAWIVGRTTMQEFCSPRKHKLPSRAPKLPRTDFVGEHKTKTYAVGIDPSGKCHWDTNMVDTEHAIEVLTEKVSDAYLHHLREKQVSYIFAGKKEIDLELALTKLRKLFGIKKARIDGGGHVNGSFLKAGLIDEFSHIVMPVADGTMDGPTVFETDGAKGKMIPKKLQLKSVKRLDGGVLWVRYSVKH
jgi:riboflavin biosynthesis pyrimidine reductase